MGEAVTGLVPGAHVIGTNDVGHGAFAEYMALPAAAAVPVPAGWAHEQALGLVVNWPAALAALKPLGGIGAGQTVLIHAAAGGTGQAAVKMAKHYGATVIAAASPGKHETVRALGADHILDSRGADIAAEVLRLTGGTGTDLVLESAGGATFELLSGQLVTPGLPEVAEKGFFKLLVNSYGKTWHTNSHDGQPGMDLPCGDPKLMWSFNRDGECKEALLRDRDQAMGVDADAKRADRQSFLELARPQWGVDDMKDDFPGTTAIPGVIDVHAAGSQAQS